MFPSLHFMSVELLRTYCVLGVRHSGDPVDSIPCPSGNCGIGSFLRICHCPGNNGLTGESLIYRDSNVWCTKYLFWVLDLRLYGENNFFENYASSKLTYLLAYRNQPQRPDDLAISGWCVLTGSLSIWFQSLDPSSAWCLASFLSTITSTSLLQFLTLRICMPAVAPLLPLK